MVKKTKKGEIARMSRNEVQAEEITNGCGVDVLTLVQYWKFMVGSRFPRSVSAKGLLARKHQQQAALYPPSATGSSVLVHVTRIARSAVSQPLKEAEKLHRQNSFQDYPSQRLMLEARRMCTSGRIAM